MKITSKPVCCDGGSDVMDQTFPSIYELPEPSDQAPVGLLHSESYPGIVKNIKGKLRPLQPERQRDSNTFSFNRQGAIAWRLVETVEL